MPAILCLLVVGFTRYLGHVSIFHKCLKMQVYPRKSRLKFCSRTSSSRVRFHQDFWHIFTSLWRTATHDRELASHFVAFLVMDLSPGSSIKLPLHHLHLQCAGLLLDFSGSQNPRECKYSMILRVWSDPGKCCLCLDDLAVAARLSSKH
jgi:hypothetical protein